MKRLSAVVFVGALLVLPELLQAQIGGTGLLRFTLNHWGRVRMFTPGDGAVRQVARASAIIAFDSASVWDYTDDADSIKKAILTTGGVADTVASAFTNGAYSDFFPSIKVFVDVYAWTNDSYLIVRHTIRNDSSVAVRGYIALAVVPQPSGEYGDETVEYDSTSRVAYYYRTAQDPYIGVRLLTGKPYSFHAMDWEQYSPDPDNDVSTDTIRAFLTIPPGVDGKLEAGPVGSIFHLTAGVWTLQPGDSVTVYYALLYATSQPALLSLADSAQARHDLLLTSVDPISHLIPEEYSLHQNFPNPFNPSTQIRFDVPRSGFVTLRVYDLLGRGVTTLVHQQLDPGTYDVAFSGTGLPSGLYVATLESSGFLASRKMLLMK